MASQLPSELLGRQPNEPETPEPSHCLFLWRFLREAVPDQFTSNLGESLERTVPVPAGPQQTHIVTRDLGYFRFAGFIGLGKTHRRSQSGLCTVVNGSPAVVETGNG